MLPIITSQANQRIKSAVALRESRKRRQRKEFLIDGFREILRAKRSGIKLREAYVVVSRENHPLYETPRYQSEQRALIAEWEENRFPVWPVTEEVFGRLAFGDRNEGMIALAEEPDRNFSLFEKRLPKNPLLGVLERIEKPGNIGAVFRSADGAGLDGIILADCGFDLYHPNSIRSSLGTLFHLPSVSVPSKEAITWLRDHKIQIAAAICDADHSYADVDYARPTAIVLGSEADGLTPDWSDRGRTGPDALGISLPMRGIADSLNISNAAAVLFYHALLQRTSVSPSKKEGR